MARTGISNAKVIKAMVLSGAETRGELCQTLGLSKAAVTQVVNRLLKEGYVEEGRRFNESPRGRKTVSLRLKPDLAYLMGTDLEGRAIRVCILDCQKNIIASRKDPIDPDWSIEMILKHWTAMIKDVLDTAKIKPKKLAAIGVGLPGKVSHDTFHCRTYFPPGRWINLDIAPVFKKFRTGIVAANNVICVSEYERRLGAAKKSDNFVSILARFGIGAAIFSHGSFLEGKDIFTGEFGHMRIDIKGPKCICGQKGCLDVFVSARTWPNINDSTQAKLKKELSKRAKYLAIALGNLLKVFHPSMVVINGIYNQHQQLFKPALLTALKKEFQGLELSLPQIVFGEKLEFKTSMGAAIRGAQIFLEPYLEKNLTARRSKNK